MGRTSATNFYQLLPCPSNLYMTSLFPTSRRGRCTGIALGLASIFGGLTPIASVQLAKFGEWAPGTLVVLLTLPSIAMLLWSRRAVARGELAVYQRSWLF